MRYRETGVDIERAAALKGALVRAATATHGRAVRPLPGGFAGAMEWPGNGRLLAATMDGVGTKLHVALAAERVSDAAADLVYHGANDLLVHGARPLALLDYVAQSRLDPTVVLAVVEGLSRACAEVGAALLGGETAEMPDTYLPGVVDVAGCMLGWVRDEDLLDGRSVREGDIVLGLASSGLHTNGYSLARRVVAVSGLPLDRPLPGGAGEGIGEALLQPHRWYGRSVLPLLGSGRVHAMAHITGGGLGGNLARVLPEGLGARVRGSAWPRPALFDWLIRVGGIPEEDARAAFNLGIGWVLVCGPEAAGAVAAELGAASEQVWEVGEVVVSRQGVEWVT